MIKKTLVLATGLASLLASQVFAVNLGFLTYDPVGQMTEEDWKIEGKATLQAVNKPDSTTVTWENPDTGHSGTITPLGTYTNNKGQTCRKVKETFKSKKYSSKYTTPMCKQADGQWRPDPSSR